MTTLHRLQAVDYEVVFACLILAFVYVLIIFELIHRTLSAMLGSFIALGVLSALNKRPSLEVVIEWIDFETIMLLFGTLGRFPLPPHTPSPPPPPPPSSALLPPCVVLSCYRRALLLLLLLLLLSEEYRHAWEEYRHA